MSTWYFMFLFLKQMKKSWSVLFADGVQPGSCLCCSKCARTAEYLSTVMQAMLTCRPQLQDCSVSLSPEGRKPYLQFCTTGIDNVASICRHYMGSSTREDICLHKSEEILIKSRYRILGILWDSDNRSGSMKTHNGKFLQFVSIQST